MVQFKNALRNFLDDDGRLKQWPADPTLKTTALRYLASRFDFNKKYPEVGVNGILNRWHTFGDPALLRRELFERKMLGRTLDCRSYWKEAPGLIEDRWVTTNLNFRDATDDVFSLRVFRIHKEYQQKGLGAEAVSGLIEQAREKNYSEMLLTVSLKNWPGLRFCTKMGFRTVNNVVGAKVYQFDSFAQIELAQSL